MLPRGGKAIPSQGCAEPRNWLIWDAENQEEDELPDASGHLYMSSSTIHQSVACRGKTRRTGGRQSGFFL